MQKSPRGGTEIRRQTPPTTFSNGIALKRRSIISSFNGKRVSWVQAKNILTYLPVFTPLPTWSCAPQQMQKISRLGLFYCAQSDNAYIKLCNWRGYCLVRIRVAAAEICQGFLHQYYTVLKIGIIYGCYTWYSYDWGPMLIGGGQKGCSISCTGKGGLSSKLLVIIPRMLDIG